MEMSRGHSTVVRHSSVTATPALVLLLLTLRSLQPSLAHRIPSVAHHHENDDGSDDHYVIDGDVMLGVILSIHGHDQENACGVRLRQNGVVQQVEAIVYALNNINKAYPPLLPARLKLGAVILDDCAKPEIALARALNFLPIAGHIEQRRSRDSVASNQTGRALGSTITESGNRTLPSTSSVHRRHDVDDGGITPLYGRISNETRRLTDSVAVDNENESVNLGGLTIWDDSISPPMEQFYDVVGVIGAESSSSSIMVSNLLGMFGIPLISPTASSDVLSDKTRFPFFLRMAPPDRYQVDAMLHIIDYFNWTYIAAVYSKGSYGENAVEHLRAAAVRHSVCIGATLAVSTSVSSKQTLRADIDARLVRTGVRIVVLFTDQEDTRLLLTTVKEMHLVGRFVWIGSDGLGLNMNDLDGFEDVVLGALALKAFSNDIPSFQDYFRYLTPRNTSNPWFRKMWADKFGCSWSPNVKNAAGQTLSPCSTDFDSDSDIYRRRQYESESIVSILYDSVHIYSAAIGRVLAKHCAKETATGSSIDHEVIRNCISGVRLLRELRATNATGYNGNISFDDNSDIRGKYEIINYRRRERMSPEDQNIQQFDDADEHVDAYEANRVGVWDTMTATLQINDADIVWNVVNHDPAVSSSSSSSLWVTSTERSASTSPSSSSPSRGSKTSSTVPISQCGRRCQPGEVYSYFKDTCCWECRRCAVNEIATANSTRCATCPPLTWPSAATISDGSVVNQTCVPIEVVDERWQMHIIVFFDVLAAVGMLYCGVVLCVYVRYRNVRLIKATSRELSCFMLVGICFQYVLVVATTIRPSNGLCYFRYVGFHSSFTVVYAPLLTRTNRIYRIFKCARRSTTLPLLTSPLSQIIITLVLVAVHLIINTVTVVTSPPTVGLRMPVPTERFVEVTCSVPVEGYVTSLVFNVMLIVVCSWYAFKTRTLPDNFNESRYITLCVYTTLIIWLAFVPSYFTTIHSYQRLVLTSSALALNATVMLLCLFTPRIYAIFHDTAAASGRSTSAIGRCSGGARPSGAACSGVLPAVDGSMSVIEYRQKVIYRDAGQLHRTLANSPCCSLQTRGTMATTAALVNAERSV